MPGPNHPVVNSGVSARQGQFRDRIAIFSVRFKMVSWIQWMECDRVDSKTSGNENILPILCLSSPDMGPRLKNRSCLCHGAAFGPQEPLLDTQALEKEPKNLDSGPFPAYFGRRLSIYKYTHPVYKPKFKNCL
jgi:hypothetical protein